MTTKISENRKIKELVLTELSEKISKASTIIVWDYLGMKAEEAANLRKKIRDTKGENKVYKNTLATIAFEKAGKTEILKSFVGSSSFLFTFGEDTDSLKVLYDFVKQNKKVKFKAGYIDGNFYDEAGVKEILGLPGRNELLSMLLSALQGNLRNLAYSLSQVAANKTE